MSIPFRCSSCGQEYPVADHHAGRLVKCAFCQEMTRAGPPAGGGLPPAGRRASSLHAPDLSPLSNLEPPKPLSSIAPPSPQYSMDYIAPPPKLVSTKKSPTAPRVTTPSTPTSRPGSAPPSPPPDTSPRIPEVAPPPPPPLPTVAPTSLRARASAPPPPPPRRDVGSGRASQRDEVWLLLSDDVARIISALLVLTMLGATVYFSNRLVALVSERAEIPEALASRFTPYMWLTAAWAVLLFFVVWSPTILAACALAGNWTKWPLPDRPYLRAAGTATLPYLLIAAVILLAMNRMFAPAIGIAIATPVVLVIALKELMGLRWSTTAVAALLLLVALPVVGLITAPVSYFAQTQFRRYTRLDEASIQQWMRENPGEAEKLAQRRAQRGAQNQPWGVTPTPTPPPSRGAPGGATGSPPPPPPIVRDPVDDKFHNLARDLLELERAVRTDTREDLEAAYDRLVRNLATMKASQSHPRWAQLNARLPALQRLIKDAPSATPPPDIFRPIDDARPASLPQAQEIDFVAAGEELSFQGVRVRALRRATIDADAFLHSSNTRRWELSPAAGIELEIIPLRDPKQYRPWVADRAALQRVATRANLLALADEGYEPPLHARINDIGWTRVARVLGGGRREVQYVGRLPNQWLAVRLKSSRPSDDEIDALDRFVQGIRLSSSPTSSPTSSPSASPASPVARASAAAAADGAPPVANAGEINTLLDIIGASSSSSWNQRDALKKLAALQPADAQQRDVVAGVLERLIVEDAAFIADDAADTLAAGWWRPQTIDALLPLLGETEWVSWKRARAMKVLGSTGDKRVATPIMRWLLKDTDAVVAALSALGPAAEDEAIARLREKEPAARAAAARILSAVGTSKCLIELRRAANDPRDPTAAAAARAALETVLARVKAAKSASSPSPATVPAR